MEARILNLEWRPVFGWSLITVLAAACVAFFVSLQLGFFLLIFSAIAWWVWQNPEEGFLLLVIIAPLLSMFKATQTIGTVTLLKDVIILTLFVRLFLWPALTKRLLYRRNILFAPIVVLGVWTVLQTLRAESLTLGILRARDIILYLLLYFGALYLPHSREAWKRRLTWFAISVSITLLLALYQWFFAADSAVLRFDPGRQIWIPRVSSTFGHPSVYGEYLVAAATLFASYALFFVRRNERILFSALFLLILPFIFLTYSRAVWIGFAAAMVVMGIVWLWNFLATKQRSARGLAVTLPGVQSAPDSRPRSFVSGEDRARFGLRNAPFAKRFLVASGTLLLFFIFVVLFRFTPAGSLLRSAFDPTYKSNEARLEFAARLVAPMSNLDAIIGRGLGDVVRQKLLKTDVGVEEVATGASRDVQLAKDQTLVDNQYLKTFVEMGLLGLVIYFWLFWRFAKGAWQNVRTAVDSTQKIVGLWALGFLAAFVVQALFIDIWDIFPTNALFWITAGLLAAALTPVPSTENTDA